MTVRDLLNKINKEKPSSFTEAEIIAFINEIEADVAEQLRTKVMAYTFRENSDEDAETESDVPDYIYGHDDELDVEMLAPAPYDRLYVSYVKAQIDYANEEYDSYENNQAQFITDFHDFVDWVVREGKAKPSIRQRRFRNVLF